MSPDVKDMKNECIMCKTHRNGYDRAVRMLGVNIIEVETKEEMEAAVNDRTAMILIMGQSIEAGPITFEDMIAIGAYVDGSNPSIDYAKKVMPKINGFLRQDIMRSVSYEMGIQQLKGIVQS